MNKQLIRLWYDAKWPSQMLVFALGAFVIFFLAGFLVSSTGPGSSRVMFLALAAYAVVVFAIGPRMPRILALVLLLASIAVYGHLTRQKTRFWHDLRERRLQRAIEKRQFEEEGRDLDPRRKGGS